MPRRDSSSPHFDFERDSPWPVCGIDEAGRGPLAGPVVAAAVILDAGRIPHGLNDSKKLPASRRERLFDEILATSRVGVGVGDVARIDSDNILAASLWAMAQAASMLGPLALALVDGNRPPPLSCPARCIVMGDRLSLSIAAASIVAKVTRDRLMRDLDAQCPGYGFARHKGYATLEHGEALARLGPSIHHRRSFAPVRRLCLRNPGATEMA